MARECISSRLTDCFLAPSSFRRRLWVLLLKAPRRDVRHQKTRGKILSLLIYFALIDSSVRVCEPIFIFSTERIIEYTN